MLVVSNKNRNRFGNSLFPTMDSFLNDFFNGTSLFDEKNYGLSSKLKVKDNEDNYVLSFALPGYKKEDVNIEIDNDIITISSEVEKDDFRSSFRSSYTLPDDIDNENINASMEDGILSITINKIKEIDNKNVKRIEIK